MIWLALMSMVASSPLGLVLLLIVVLFFLSLSLASILSSYLFSYLVFMLFMSGLIMMLMYFCSITLNDKTLFWGDAAVLGFLLLVYGSSNWSYSNFEMGSGFNISYLYCEFYNLLKYLVYSYSCYSFFFIVFLLLCLVVVYEIVGRCSGPLRMKM